MLFTDSLFLFYFLPASLILHRLASNVKPGSTYPGIARYVIFFLTLLFYGFKQPWWLIPFATCIVFDFIWGTLISRSRTDRERKFYMALSITQNLALLSVFKYWSFLLTNFAKVAPALADALPRFTQDGVPLALPPGISFYTFESMSFVIDVYRRKVAPPQKPHEFFAFIGMFPRFVAGPIVRYTDMVEQFRCYRGMRVEAGLFLFSLGLFLKCCFADSFAFFVTYGFSRTEQIEWLSAWVGILSYTMQLYFDFSGYSLMAIGLGRCLGFQFPTNFDRPYTAASLQEFWRRWHISLSTWLRDYLYVSLGGNRKGVLKTYRNLFLTMLLGGLWHGAEWTFVVWGAWHGAILCLERKFKWNERMGPVAGQITTFLIVIVGWTFFRARKLPEAFKTLKTMFNPLQGTFDFNPEALFANPMQFGFCILGLIYCFALERRLNIPKLEKLEQVPLSLQAAGASMLIISILIVMSSRTIPFLYFQF